MRGECNFGKKGFGGPGFGREDSRNMFFINVLRGHHYLRRRGRLDARKSAVMDQVTSGPVSL